MSVSGLSIKPVEFITTLLLRRAPISSSLRTPYRNTGLRIIPPPLIQGPLAERISSSLALCPTFDLAPSRSSGPVFGQGLFFDLVRFLSPTCPHAY